MRSVGAGNVGCDHYCVQMLALLSWTVVRWECNDARGGEVDACSVGPMFDPGVEGWVGMRQSRGVG